MKNLNVTHNNKTFSVSYNIWSKVRNAAFDREMPIKELVEDIVTGKCAPINTEAM